MPAYKYKAHRRKSLEPVDNLALPSVSCCLVTNADGTAQAGHCFTAQEGKRICYPPGRVSTKISHLCHQDSKKSHCCVLLSSYFSITGIKCMTYLQMLYYTEEKSAIWSCMLLGHGSADLFQALTFQHNKPCVRVPVFLSTDVRESKRQGSLKYSQCRRARQNKLWQSWLQNWFCSQSRIPAARQCHRQYY